MIKQTTYISINPDLKNDFGHYLHYDLNVKKVVEQDGAHFLSFSNQSNSLKEHSFVKPIFGRTTYDVIPNLNIAEINRFSKELSGSIRNYCAPAKNKEYVFFMYMGSAWHLAAILKVAKQLKREDCTFCINIFHFRSELLADQFANTNYAKEHELILNYAAKEGKQLGVEYFFCTETAIARIKQLYAIDVTYFPMFSVSNFSSVKTSSTSLSNRKLRICYPSNVQKDKGFDILVEALNKIDLEQIEVTCRTFISYPNAGQKLWLSKLPNHPNLQQIDGSLSTTDYQALLQSADVLLIPYRKEAFWGRTSGIYADAIQLEKPVIITKQTWGGQWTTRLGNGWSFEDGDADDLSAQINKLKLEYPAIKAKLSKSKKEWLKTNGIDNFYRFLQQSIQNNNIQTTNDESVELFWEQLKKQIQIRNQQLGNYPIRRLKRNKMLQRMTATIKRLFPI